MAWIMKLNSRGVSAVTVLQSKLSHPDYVHTPGIVRCIACMGTFRSTKMVVYKRL